jgi:hypothetical protein
VNEGVGAGPTAGWAVLGKYPGEVMGYEVLAGSLPEDRAGRYLWTAATGTPDAKEGEDGALPWRVFLGRADGEPGAVCAWVETTWDGSRDGTGAASYTSRLVLVEWARAAAAGLTWTGIDRAAGAMARPRDGEDAALGAVRTTAAELAATVDALGFEWAAGVAALLLDGRKVALTAPPGGELPGTDERVRVLDAVCSLLPYGCRSWLSAATWTGRSENPLLLVFASRARTGQQQVPLGAGPPPQPQGDTARAYLRELLRLRAKRPDTAEVVAHLLAYGAEIPFRDRAETVYLLREMDLLDSVAEDLRAGRARLADVRRALDRNRPAERLPDDLLRLVVPYLARLASAGGPDEDAARAVLAEHWTPRVPELLAEDIADAPALQPHDRADAFELAARYLSVLADLDAAHPGGFDLLFTRLVRERRHGDAWAGQLAYMAENRYGHTSEAVDRVLASEGGVGLAWLQLLLSKSTRDLAPLLGLLDRAALVPAGERAGWLRFAGVLTGRLPGHASATDAADFAGAADRGWRIALETARENNRPDVLPLMWQVLRGVPASDARYELLPLLDRLAPPGAPGLSPGVAADADLLHVLHRAGSSPGAQMPRLRRMPAVAQDLDDYADAVRRRAEREPELPGPAVEALLGASPDPVCWHVLNRWRAAMPSLDETVLAGLADRLNSAQYGPWLDYALPEDLVDALGRRPGLEWLPAVHRLRTAVRTDPSVGNVARIIREACPSPPFPAALLEEIAATLGTLGADFIDALTTELDAFRVNLGFALYKQLGSGATEATRKLRAGLVHFSTAVRGRHDRILQALGAAPPDTGQGPPGYRPPRQPAPYPPPPAPYPPPAPHPPAYRELPPAGHPGEWYDEPPAPPAPPQGGPGGGRPREKRRGRAFGNRERS